MAFFYTTVIRPVNKLAGSQSVLTSTTASAI